MGTKIKQDSYDDIVAKYNSGMNSCEIAKIYNVKYGAIIRVLKICNVKIEKHYSIIFYTEHENIVKRYRSGEKISEIAKSYYVVRETIAKILKSNGVQPREKGQDNRKYQVNHNYFDSIDNENKAYFLGMLFADGYNDGKYYICLGLQSSDVYIINKLIDELYIGEKPIASYEERSKDKSGKKDICRYTVCSSKISSSLSRCGMIKKKSLCLKYPQDFLPPLYFKHFLRGYFDGDGSAWIEKQRLKISPTGKHYMLNPHLVFNMVGTYNMLKNMKINIEESIGEKIKCKICKVGKIYSWCVTKRSILEKIYHLMYDEAEIFMTRKRDKFEMFFG